MTGSGDPVPTRARHEYELSCCLDALLGSRDAGSFGLELTAEFLRRAGDHLGRLTGVIGVEEVLGEIFGSFCVGK
jgi:tRNA modification GTPase